MTHYTLTIDDQKFEVEIGAIQGNQDQVVVNRTPYQVTIGDGAPSATPPMPQRPTPPPMAVESLPRNAAPALAGNGFVTAPIPGIIVALNVQPGDVVAAGQVQAVMEAMKMENNIICPKDGQVKEIRVSPGKDVATGEVLMVIGR